MSFLWGRAAPQVVKPPSGKVDEPPNGTVEEPSPSAQASTTKQRDKPEAHLIIGIDFGTTYSGVAWAYSEQPDQIHNITHWENTEPGNSDKGKTPSKITYGRSDEVMAWGYEADSTNALEWFKLMLLDERDMDVKQKQADQIKHAWQLLENLNKSPTRVVADYLRLLWKHTLQVIERHFGPTVVKGLPFQVVVTVPAVWPQSAVNRMHHAVRLSGILDARIVGDTTLSFISEPEAAALATFEDLKARPNFQVGDTFVVCDAGGGTVDLISYKVRKTDPLELDECVEGSGRLCGAIFLDNDFKALMKQLMGEGWNIPESEIQFMLNQYWENLIKPGFYGQEKDWTVRLPYESIQKGSKPHIILKKGHIAEVFDHVISQIRKLVNDQITNVEKKTSRLPKAVVLVGGFGSCKYLFEQLKSENSFRGIEVYQSSGLDPWTAICRGAVLRGVTNIKTSNVLVQSRISRCSYGHGFNTAFDKSKHLNSDRYLDEVTGTYRARNQLAWYLRRGEVVTTGKPVRKNWHRHVEWSKEDDSYWLEEDIYSSSETPPPSRLMEGVTRCGTITPDGRINLGRMSVVEGKDAKRYRKVQFQTEMTVIGTALDFSLWFEGKKFASQTVQPEVG